MQKSTKEAFSNTNKRPDLIRPQLLANRLTIVHRNANSEPPSMSEIKQYGRSCAYVIPSYLDAIQKSIYIVNDGTSYDERQSVLGNLKYDLSHKVWTKSTYKTLSILFPWEE